MKEFDPNKEKDYFKCRQDIFFIIMFYAQIKDGIVNFSKLRKLYYIDSLRHR